MNKYNFNVKFEKGKISSNLKKLVQNDYNSTKINFTFDKEGRKLFKMLYPDETAYITQIDNDELIFGPGVLNQDGTYEVEIALYTEDGRLTDYATTKFDVRAELIQSDEIVELDDRLPILDSLINDVQGVKTEIEDAIQYATEQGDYAKEQANRNFDAIEEATKIVDNFEENVNEYKEDFDNNAIFKTNDFNSNVDEKTTIFDNHVIDGIDTFNTNATTKLNEYNTNSSSKLEEYNTNATAKLKEYNANADGLMTIAVDTRNELERIKNDVLETGEASGNYLTLNDSTMAEYQKLEVDGVCEQVVTTGKNLFDYTRLKTNNHYGITSTILHDDGSITIEGLPTRDYVVICDRLIIDDILEDGATYTISQTNVNPNFYLQISINKSDGTIGYIYLANEKSRKFTVDKSKNSYEINIQTGMLSNWGTASRKITNSFQLEKGDVATEFEKYTNGVATPRPDYPQEISVIENELKVVSCNKNLFDYTLETLKTNNTSGIWEDNKYTYNGITFTINEDRTILLDGTATANANILLYGHSIASKQRKIKGKYICLGYTTNDIYIRALNNTNGYVFLGTNASSSISSELDLSVYDTGYIEIIINKDKTVSNTLVKPILSTTPQIGYEEHLETVINANLGNEFIGKINDTAKDTLRVSYNEEDGEYHLYLDKAVKKVVLNGDENWRKSGNTNDNYFVGVLTENDCLNVLKTKNSDIVCSHFTKGDLSIKECYSFYNEDSLKIYTAFGLSLETKKVTTIEQFKQWLSTNNVTVYYETTEPYTIDLGVIDMPITYDEVTNLFTDSDLMPIINAKYYRNFTETVRNLQINNDTLKNELASIENRLSALEAAQVSVVNESEVIE